MRKTLQSFSIILRHKNGPFIALAKETQNHAMNMVYDAFVQSVKEKLFKPIGNVVKLKVLTRSVQSLLVVLGHGNGPLMDVPEKGLEKIMSVISVIEIDNV